MTEIFMDTVGLLALWNRTDQWHARATEAMQRMLEGPLLLYTTAYVLLECGNAAARTPFRDEVDTVREQFEQGATLVHPSADDWWQAWRAYRQNANAGAGIVDQISFIVMRRLGLTRAFTNDRHFQAAGFEPLF